MHLDISQQSLYIFVTPLTPYNSNGFIPFWLYNRGFRSILILRDQKVKAQTSHALYLMVKITAYEISIIKPSELLNELSRSVFTPPLWSLCLFFPSMSGMPVTGDVRLYGALAPLSDVGCWVMGVHPSVLLSCSTSDWIKYVQRIYWLKNHKSPTNTSVPDHL